MVKFSGVRPTTTPIHPVPMQRLAAVCEAAQALRQGTHRTGYTIVVYLDIPSGTRIKVIGPTLISSGGKKLYFTAEDRAQMDMWIHRSTCPKGYRAAVQGRTLCGTSQVVTTNHIFWHVDVIKKRHEKKFGVKRNSPKTLPKKKLPKQLRGEKNQKGVASTDHQAYVFLSAATLIHIDPEDLSNYAVRKSNLAEV